MTFRVQLESARCGYPIPFGGGAGDDKSGRQAPHEDVEK